jgi:hypothetical protein
METLGSVKNVKIVTAAVAYDVEDEYKTYILFFHQALYIPSMNRHLLNHNHMRVNDVTVNETPLALIPQELRTLHSHSIVAEDTDSEEVHIPLELEGVTSYFKTRKPTRAEIQDTQGDNCTHVHMTATSAWEPYDGTLAHQEVALRNSLNYNAESCVRGRKVQSVATMASLGSLKRTPIHLRSHKARVAMLTRHQWSPHIDIDSYANELE